MAPIRIGELLVREGLITPSQLAQALTAQQVFGGRLGTNLVESGFVSEVDLARVLSRQLGIRMVEPQELSAVEPRVIALVTPELARKYEVVPFRHDGARDRVSLAVADPANLQKVDEIQFALGRRIDWHVSPEIMLSFALEKYYGVERPKRYIRISGVADAEMQAFQTADAPPAARRPRAAAAAATAPGAGGGAAPGDAMLRRIVAAEGKQELVSTATQLLAGWCQQVVFLAARGSDLVCWEAAGVPVPLEKLRTVTLAAGASPVLDEVFATCRHRFAGVPDESLRAVLEDALFLDVKAGAFLLPLIVNRRVFGVFVLAGAEDPGFEDRLPLLVELMKRVGYKLQIFYLTEHLTAPL